MGLTRVCSLFQVIKQISTDLYNMYNSFLELINIHVSTKNVFLHQALLTSRCVHLKNSKEVILSYLLSYIFAVPPRGEMWKLSSG